VTQYIVMNQHEPERCRLMDEGIEKIGAALKGKDFYCTCPFGEHRFFMFLEGDSSDDVIAGLPPEWRPGTRALPLEVFHLPE
jgi:hypothetical protein